MAIFIDSSDPKEIKALYLWGAHILTITPPILRKTVWNPRTQPTIERFSTAWRNGGKK